MSSNPRKPEERNLEKEKGKNYWTEIQQEASHQQSSTRPEPYLGVEATVWEDDKSSLYDNFIFSWSFLLGCFFVNNKHNILDTKNSFTCGDPQAPA